MKKNWNDVKKWPNVKEELKELIGQDARSHLAIFKEAGLSIDLYYKLMSSERTESPMRESTVMKLAKVLNVDCTYHGEYPYFGRVSLAFLTENGATVQEILEFSLQKLDGDLGDLSYRIHLPVALIQQLLATDKTDDSVSLDTLRWIANVIGLNVSVWTNNKIALMGRDLTVPPIPPPEFTPEPQISNTVSEDLDDGKITDSGLSELLEEKNVYKHSIIDLEIKDLINLHKTRSTNATLAQWVSVLYALRGLGQA